MATLNRLPLVPQCMSCIRRAITEDISYMRTPFHRQLRGKKKTARQPSTIKVKLRQDIVGYGRTGSIIPVAPGRMRNIWYPHRMAEYMTHAQLREMPDVVAERDFTFGTEQPEVVKVEKEEMVDVQMKLLVPSRATEVMAATLPAEITFYRTPISAPNTPTLNTPEAPKDIQTTDFSATILPGGKAEMIPIYGSVSTADIAEEARAALSMDEEGRRVVLGSEDISIIREQATEDGMEPGRIKALGVFTVDIRVKGGNAVRRTVRVKAQASNEQQ